MPDFGVTPTGFVIRTLENLNAFVLSAVQSAIGVFPTDSLLKILEITNACFAELWELGQQVYDAGDVDAATGDAQDKVNSITGTLRADAEFSTVVLSWTGNPGIVLNTQSRAKTNVSLQVFTTDINGGTLVSLPAWVASTAYLVGDRVTNLGRCYVCTTSGTSAGSGGPGTTGTAITDNTVVWRYMGDGTAVVDVESHAIVTGPVTALAGSITLIDTFQSGVTGVINLLDAVLGSDVETDADYRVRRVVELAQPGSGTAAAIRAALTPTAVPGISNVTVFQNVTDSTNADGMPEHTVEVLAVGGDDTEIATIIFANVDGGINTHGNTSVFIVDEQGFTQEVKFSRPVDKLIYNTIDLNIDSAKFPANGTTLVKEAIVAYGATVESGDNVESSRIAALSFSVLGVRGFSSSLQSVHPVTVPVSSATITIASRELARFDSTRIVINTTPVVP